MTLVFSSFNGADTLPRMLGSLERLEAPKGAWKAVAVDNGSTDDTPALLAEGAARMPMTVIHEPRRGKNRGLNAALEHTEGDIVAFTDDDTVLPADWLVGIRRQAEQNPGYDIFGGSIYPVWDVEPPDWVLRSAPRGPCFTWTDFPEGPISSWTVWGPSMAVRSTVFRAIRFAEWIGPDGTTDYAMGSETEFAVRAERAGHRCWHFRTPAVGHIIRDYQLEPEWLVGRAYRLARGQRRIFGPGKLPKLLGVRRDLICLLIAASLAIEARIFGDVEAQFKAAWKVRWLQGKIADHDIEVIGSPAGAFALREALSEPSAVRPPNPHITPNSRRDLVHAASRVLCSARPWSSSPKSFWRFCLRARWRQP